MRQMRTGSLGRKGWTLIMALCVLTLLLAPVAVDAKIGKATPSPASNNTPNQPPTPSPTLNQTLDQILSGLPNGQPFKLLAQAIQFVEGQVTQLQQQVADLLDQSKSITIDSPFGTTAILSDQAPGTEHVRLEVSFVPTSGDPPAANTSYIMYAVVSVESLTEINFISAGNNGLQTANNATVLPTTIASISGIADLVAITGTNGVTFELVEQGSTGGTYFVKVIK
jgi:hypothetical protein